MIVSVEHSTIYRYNRTVTLEPHTFRLRPRMTTTQRLLTFNLQILPTPAGSAESLDQDGNLAHLAWFSTPMSELNVTSTFRVELVRSNPFDFNLPTHWQNLALSYTHPLSESLAVYSNAQRVDGAVKRFATSVADETNWNFLWFLSTLNRRMFETFKHVTRPEGPAWHSGQTFQCLEGSCRDLALLFCDACRVMGIASRFVSGYECASVGQSNASMHAWAEVYIPNAGWRGYDPSRGLAVADRHVAVAAALDQELAAPISGLLSGPCESQMDTRVDMQIDAY